MGAIAVAVAAWLANPANEAILISLVEGAVKAGETLYTDLQLKSLNDLLAAVKANTAQLAADVQTMDVDIDARDGKLQADLDAAKP